MCQSGGVFLLCMGVYGSEYRVKVACSLFMGRP